MEIGIIALGGASDNILNRWINTYNIKNTLSINTNQSDMNNYAVKQFVIEGSSGVAKNRELAKSLFTNEVQKELVTVMDSTFDNVDLIYLLCAGGGGTGSGITPILTKLLVMRYKDKIICPVMGIPYIKNASARELRNTANCMLELSENKNHSYMAFQSMEDLEETDNIVIENLMYPFLPRTSIKELIDNSEIKTMYKERGLLTPSMSNSSSKKHKDIFLSSTGVEVTGLFCDNMELPKDIMSKITGQVFRGNYKTDLPKGIFKIESGQTINVTYLQNIKKEIVKKEKAEITIQDKTLLIEKENEKIKALEF